MGRQAAEKDPKAYQEALKHEPVYNFAGVGSISLVAWLAMGRPTPKEFGKMMQQTLPNPTKARLNEYQLGWFSKDRHLSDEELRQKRELQEEEKSSYPQWLQD